MKMTVKNPNVVDRQDTFQVGHGITLFGSRYLVETVEYVGNLEGGVTLRIDLRPWSKCDPALYAFDAPKPKKRRIRTKAKKK